MGISMLVVVNDTIDAPRAYGLSTTCFERQMAPYSAIRNIAMHLLEISEPVVLEKLRHLPVEKRNDALRPQHRSGYGVS